MAKKTATKRKSTSKSKRTSTKKVSSKSARREYPPGKSDEVPYDLVYVADSDIHGKGMFARKSIDANMTLGKLEGKPANRDGIYVLWLSDRKAMTVTNDFKYINHGSKPNCALTGTEVVTLRKIKPHEELLHDYGWE